MRTETAPGFGLPSAKLCLRSMARHHAVMSANVSLDSEGSSLEEALERSGEEGSFYPSAHSSGHVLSGSNFWTRQTGWAFFTGDLGFVGCAFLCAKNKLHFRTFTSSNYLHSLTGTWKEEFGSSVWGQAVSTEARKVRGCGSKVAGCAWNLCSLES